VNPTEAESTADRDPWQIYPDDPWRDRRETVTDERNGQ
jgi:hypothetical protein